MGLDMVRSNAWCDGACGGDGNTGNKEVETHPFALRCCRLDGDMVRSNAWRYVEGMGI